MAVKKSEPAKKEAPAAATKAPAKKAAPKKKAAVAVKKAAPKKAAAPKAAAPKAKAPAAAAKKVVAAPKKKAPAVKLTDKQTDILKKIKGTGETGYASAVKLEERTLEALKEKKLLKRGAKSKDTGKHHYTLTKTGEKHLGTPTGSPA